MEIERKFLVSEFPKDLKVSKHISIRQGYLSRNPEIRIRKECGNYFLTTKGEGSLCREEHEASISKEIFEDLKEIIDGEMIIKDRFLIHLSNGSIAELDMYQNIEGLIATVEVEFSSEESAKEFIVPSWFGEEVTERKEYKNKNLALKVSLII